MARSVGQLPDGLSQALRCLARAGMLAQDVPEWLAVAKAWTQDFNDSEMAQQCLAKAESYAEDSEDWVRIAEVWVEMGCYSRAIEIYRESVEPRPWRYLTELENIHGGNSDGTTGLDWVEPGMTARASRDLVSEAEEYFSDNHAMAIRILVEAEYRAERSSDWIRIARKWNEEFQDSDSGNRCMEEAEGNADDIYDWVRIAKTWKKDFQDLDNGIRCMKEAELHAGDADSWEWTLETWKEDFKDTDNYLRCVEECAKHLEDPCSCIEKALYDKFVYDRFVREQVAFVDLGALTESIRTRIGIFCGECISERQPGSYARYYEFQLPQAAEVTIYLESNEDNPVNPYLYLINGNIPNGEVLGKDHGPLSFVNCSLPAGPYTLEATTEEKATEISKVNISVKT